MKDASELSQRYKSLFSLPTTRKMIFLMGFVTFIYILPDLTYLTLNGTLTSVNIINVLLCSALLWVLYFVFLIFMIILTLFFIGKDRFILDFRRLTGLYTISLAIGLPVHYAALIPSLMGHILIYHALEAISLGIILSYILLSIPAITRTSVEKTLMIGYSYVTLALLIKTNIMHNVNSDMLTIAFYYVSTAFFASISLITLFAVNSLGKEKKVNALDAFRGFMAAWLVRDSSRLEEFFSKIGVKRDIKMGYIGFIKNNNDIKALWILSNVHPGPFLNVGSARMPYILSKTLEDEKQIESVSVLHGTCSHYHNLTKAEEILKIKKWIQKSLEGMKPAPNTDFNFYRFNRDPLTFLILDFPTFTTNIVTCEKCSMDDISYQLGLLVNEKTKSLQKETFLIDAHNSLDRENIETPADVKPWDHLGKIIIENVSEATRINDQSSGKLLLGVSKIRDCELKIEDGLGSDGIAAYLLEINEKKLGIIVIDSNNLHIGLRNKLREMLLNNSEFNLDELEILTTDTHEVNAASPKEGSYPLLGERNIKTLYQCIKHAMKQAYNNIEEVQVIQYIGEINNLNVWGEENYDFLKMLVYQGLKMFKYVFNMGLAFSSILTLLLSLLL